MKTNLLITVFIQGDSKKWQILHDLIYEDFDVWAAEMDEGLFFISSSMNPEEILEKIHSAVELGLSDTVYVFEISGSYAGTGSSTTLQTLREKLGE